jgi:hypothetical protein
MTLPLCRFKPQTEKNSLTGFRSSHLDVCTSVEHAYPSYGHIVLHVTHTRFTHTWGQVPAKILYPNPTPMHGLFTMGRANKERERERLPD